MQWPKALKPRTVILRRGSAHFEKLGQVDAHAWQQVQVEEQHTTIGQLEDTQLSEDDAVALGP